jgi:hypothetical protein
MLATKSFGTVARTIEVEITFIDELRVDSIQVVLGAIHFRVFCLAVSCLKTKLHGLSPRANYTDRTTAACQRS